MIVVKFELHSANGGGVRELGRLNISNVGDSAGTKPEENISDYFCEVILPADKHRVSPIPRVGMFRVNQYPRKDGFLRLVQRALSRVIDELGYAVDFKIEGEGLCRPDQKLTK